MKLLLKNSGEHFEWGTTILTGIISDISFSDFHDKDTLVILLKDDSIEFADNISKWNKIKDSNKDFKDKRKDFVKDYVREHKESLEFASKEH